MLIEMRTYTCLPGKLPALLALVEEQGMPLQVKHLGRCIGFYTTEVGTLNQLVQLWAYDDAADREARRTQLWADPDWTPYADAALPLINRQENCLLRPTPFCAQAVARSAAR